jgi:hypothetical protein
MEGSPPEILFEIMSYYFMFESGTWREVCCTSRSICRKIRSVIDNLPFWYDEDFQFEWLCPEDLKHHTAVAKYLGECFLADNHLKECLSRRKRKW